MTKLLLLLLLALSSAASAEIASLKSSGFLKIDCTGRALFYSLYGHRNIKSDKVIVWLQGGPGASSIWGALYINGPMIFDNTNKLVPNPWAWTNLADVMYVDNPVGVGFSRPGTTGRLVNYTYEAAADFSIAFKEFLKSNNYKSIYISGESYAGRYVPEFAHKLIEDGVHVTGTIIGNGWTHPILQFRDQASVAWFMGFINNTVRATMQIQVDLTYAAMKAENWTSATLISNAVLDSLGAAWNGTIYNAMAYVDYDAQDAVTQYINTTKGRMWVGAPIKGNYSSTSDDVANAMNDDVMQSSIESVQFLKDKNVPMLFYSGQFDAVCGFASNDLWLSQMFNFTRFTNLLPGYLYSDDHNHHHALIRNAGHMAARDQAEVVVHLLEKFVAAAL